MNRFLVLSVLCCGILTTFELQATTPPGVVVNEFIYTEAPFPQCHASTIEEADDGTLVAAWFGGTHEKHPDVGVWVSRHVDGKWTTPVESANGVQSPQTRYPCWNPVLFQPKQGPLTLYFKVGPDVPRWWGEMMLSSDNGQTWTNRRKLPDGGIGPVKNKPVQLKDGTVLCGSSTEHDGWRVHFVQTDDWGRDWSKTDTVNDGDNIAAIQPSILFHGGKKLQSLGRTRQRHLFEIWSEDNGKTWGPMTLMSLPNPNAGTDAVTLADGRHLLVYNHTPRGRTPLNVAVSDDGKHWKAALVLENEPGEYSYPAVIQSDDGLVHITYTWKRRRIKHVAVDPAKLVLVDMPNGQWPK